MWYDKMVIKVLLIVSKILARRSESSYAFEIEKLEKEMFEREEK